MNAHPIPSSLVIHPAKADLLARIQALSPRIARLEEEKAGCQSLIDQYYRRFRAQLGHLLIQTTELQMKLALRRASQTGRRSDSEEAQTWQERFAQTNRVVQEAIAHQPAQLDETAESELRRLYRQAVMLAHPDRHASDPDRMVQATTFMARLNDVYKQRDLAAVRRLVRELNESQWLTDQSETTYELAVLQQWYERLVDRQTRLQLEIDTLKAEESYRLVTHEGELMAHFSNLQQRMQQQIDHLGQLLHAS